MKLPKFYLEILKDLGFLVVINQSLTIYTYLKNIEFFSLEHMISFSLR